MKTRETKQNDLNALTASLAASKSAMVMSFTKLSVQKDQEFRNSLRSAGAQYQVVKNTIARRAVKGTDFEQASDSFKGVTAIAWTEGDPVVLTKAVSKFMKDNADIYTFKTGVVDGNLVDFTQLNVIANLPSKEELISKLLYVLNAQAQRIVTVINAVPRDLAVVIKRIGDKIPAEAAAPAAEVKTEQPAAEVKTEEPAAAPAEEAAAAEPASSPEPTEAAPAEQAPETATEAQEEAAVAAPDDAAEAAQPAAPAEEENILEIPEAEAPAEEKAE